MRSAVRIDASGPATVPMVVPASTAAPSSTDHATSTAGSSWAKASVAQSMPATTPGLRTTKAAVAASSGGNRADVRSPSGVRSSAMARATASRTAWGGGCRALMGPPRRHRP